jgi:hypothetical protein
MRPVNAPLAEVRYDTLLFVMILEAGIKMSLNLVAIGFLTVSAYRIMMIKMHTHQI